MVPSPFHMGDDDDSGGLLHFSNATREGKWRAKGCWLSVALNVALVITTIVLASSSSRTHHSSACTDSSATAELVSTQLGAVAADEARCSDIGAAVLDDGGNAIDAAVAATLSGAAAPAGRMPYTVPRVDSDLPPITNYDMNATVAGRWLGRLEQMQQPTLLPLPPLPSLLPFLLMLTPA